MRLPAVAIDDVAAGRAAVIFARIAMQPYETSEPRPQTQHAAVDWSEPVALSAAPATLGAGLASRFLFTKLAALRAKQLLAGARPRLDTGKPLKIPRQAQYEVAAGFVPFLAPGISVPEVRRVSAPSSARDLGLSVAGADSFVLDSPASLDDLQASFEMAAIAPSPPSPAEFMQRWAHGGREESGDPQWTTWPALMHALGVQQPAAAAPAPLSDFGAALEVASTCWKGSPGDQLTAVILTASPGGIEASLSLECERGAFVIYPGSLSFSLVQSFLRPVSFTIALIRKRGMPSVQAADIRNRLRHVASQRPGVERLPSLDDIDDAALAGKRGVIVFIHGLISTDIGLFDPLIRRLRARVSDVQLVGFPHDTFSHIVDNQQVLVNWCQSRLGLAHGEKERLPVVFVAHSRGGLVARCAAATLFGSADRRWREQIPGCVTFGTPHTGAALAEAPEKLVPLVAAMSALAGIKSAWSVADVLTYFGSGGRFPGVSDLKPQSQQPADGFFATLNELEASHGRVDLLVFGGDRAMDKRIARMVGRALGNQPHDHVVEQASTLAKSLFLPSAAQVTVNCNHFSYFTDDQLNRPHLTRAVEYIATRFGSQITDVAMPA